MIVKHREGAREFPRETPVESGISPGLALSDKIDFRCK